MHKAIYWKDVSTHPAKLAKLTFHIYIHIESHHPHPYTKRLTLSNQINYSVLFPIALNYFALFPPNTNSFKMIESTLVFI